MTEQKPPLEEAAGKASSLSDLVHHYDFTASRFADWKASNTAVLTKQTTLGYLQENPAELEAVESKLKQKNIKDYRYHSSGWFGVALRFEHKDRSYILNLRDNTPHRRQYLVEQCGADAQTMLSESLLMKNSVAILRPLKVFNFNVKTTDSEHPGSSSKYMATVTPLLRTMEEAVDSWDLTDSEADFLRLKLARKLASEDLFMWDSKQANIVLADDNTPYLVDIGAAEHTDSISSQQIEIGLNTLRFNHQRLVQFWLNNMPESFPDELVKVLRLVGAEIVLRPNERETLLSYRKELCTALGELELPLGKHTEKEFDRLWDGKWQTDDGQEKQQQEAYLLPTRRKA